MKKIIHVNQAVIKSNRTHGENEPPLTIKTHKDNRYAQEVDIVVNGAIVATVRHSPDKPLSCGARVWIETYHEVELRGEAIDSF